MAEYNTKDPLAEAINGLRAGFSGAVESQRRRKREDEADREHTEDRERSQAAAQRQQEDSEFTRYGQRSVNSEEMLGAVQAARKAGRPKPAPLPVARLGRFVPGKGFDLPELPQQELAPLEGGDIAGGKPAGGPELPQYEQVGEDRFIDPAQLPAERERRRVRQAYEGLVTPEQAGSLAEGVDPSVVLPYGPGGREQRMEDLREQHEIGREGEGWEPQTQGQAESLARARTAGSGGTDTTDAVTLRARALGAAAALQKLDRPRTERQKAAYEAQVAEILSDFGFRDRAHLHRVSAGLGPAGEAGGEEQGGEGDGGAMEGVRAEITRMMRRRQMPPGDDRSNTYGREPAQLAPISVNARRQGEDLSQVAPDGDLDTVTRALTAATDDDDAILAELKRRKLIP